MRDTSSLDERIAAIPVDKLRGIYRNFLLDSAEDDSRIRAIAKSHGIDVDGDSHFVPDIVFLVERLSERLTEFEETVSP